MPEMTADQAIEKLKTLKPDDQRLVLSRLTPEKRQAIGRVAFTANPKGEGLYRMLPASDQGFTRTEDVLQVPFSKVAHAQSAGYSLHPDESSRYQKDFAHPGEGPGMIATAADKFKKAIEPVPSEQAAKEKFTSPLSNKDRAALRVLAQTPGYLRNLASAASDLATGKSDGRELMDLIDPTKMPEGMYNQFVTDLKSDPKLAMDNLVGTLVGLGVVHKATQAVQQGIANVTSLKPKPGGAIREGIRETLGVPEHTERMVSEFGKASQKVRDQHQAAEEKTLLEQGKVDEANEKAKQALEAKNAAEQKKVNESNIAQLKKEAQERLDALKKNRANVQNYDEEVARVKAENDTNLRREKQRQKLEAQHGDASKRLDQKLQNAFKKATVAYNTTWNKWRDLVKGQTAKMNTVVDTIKAQEASMNPQQQSIFRDILRTTQPSEETMSGIDQREELSQQSFGKAYKDLTPGEKTVMDQDIAQRGIDLSDPGLTEVPASRLHGWKSQLERAVRGTSDGIVRYAVAQVLKQVRSLEEQVSGGVPGAAEQLKKARSITGPYFDAFFKSPEDLPKEAGRTLREQSPEYAKQKTEQDRLNRIAAYDPSIIGAAKHVENLEAGLKELPKTKDFKNLPPKPVHIPKPPSKPLKTFTPETRETTPYKEPEAQEPLAETPNIRDENLHFMNQKLRVYGRVGAWVLRLVAGGLAAHVAHGNLSVFSSDLLLGQAGVTMLVNALRRPSVLEWLSHPTKEDLELVDTLPPQDAVRLREALGALSREEIRQDPAKAKTKIAPIMATFLAGQSVGQADQKKEPGSVQDLKKEAGQRMRQVNPGEAAQPNPAAPSPTPQAALTQPALNPQAGQYVAQQYQQTATGPNGHKIGSNDSGKTWYDVETGKQVK